MSNWPVTLVSQDGLRPVVVLRPLTRRDRRDWEDVRRRNLDHVGQWEPTMPDGRAPRLSFRQYVRNLDHEGRAGRMLPFAIDVEGRLAGQMHLFGIVDGSLLSGAAGYWVAREAGGHGVATRALAMLCDHAFGLGGLHRVEVNIRPENVRSLRVVEHLRFRDEGLRERYLHINGDWRDHRTFALTREEVATPLVVQRWVERFPPGPGTPYDGVERRAPRP